MTSTVVFNDTMLREGAELLQIFLTGAQEYIDEHGIPDVDPPNFEHIHEALFYSHCTSANMEALLIRQDNAGWHADLMFTASPFPHMNIIGSRSDRPFSSMEDALDHGQYLVWRYYFLEKSGKIPPLPAGTVQSRSS